VTRPARLLSVRLQGFKSFAERTHVAFGPGISAVVGPNGSGKSNLADALRWALGEQGRASRPDVARKPRRETEEVELPSADQVKRASHQRGLVDKLSGEGSFELFSFEVADPRPKSDVGRRGVLRLHTGEPLDRRNGIELNALKQQLTGKRPAIQLSERDGRQSSGCARGR